MSLWDGGDAHNYLVALHASQKGIHKGCRHSFLLRQKFYTLGKGKA